MSGSSVESEKWKIVKSENGIGWFMINPSGFVHWRLLESGLCSPTEAGKPRPWPQVMAGTNNKLFCSLEVFQSSTPRGVSIILEMHPWAVKKLLYCFVQILVDQVEVSLRIGLSRAWLEFGEEENLCQMKIYQLPCRVHAYRWPHFYIHYIHRSPEALRYRWGNWIS